MYDEVTESLCDTNNTFEEEFLRDIFHQTPQDLFTSLPIANDDSSINVVSHSTASLDHIMSERKRRKEITIKFIELSALLPGLKKVSLSINSNFKVKYFICYLMMV